MLSGGEAVLCRKEGEEESQEGESSRANYWARSLALLVWSNILAKTS